MTCWLVTLTPGVWGHRGPADSHNEADAWQVEDGALLFYNRRPATETEGPVSTFAGAYGPTAWLRLEACLIHNPVPVDVLLGT